MNNIILNIIVYVIGASVIIFPRLFSHKVKVKGKCIDIKKSSNMKCPVFEVHYNNESRVICNECYTSKLEMQIGDNYNLYINENDINNFDYNDRKPYRYTDIFGIMIFIFAIIFLCSLLNLNVKILIVMIFTILGGFLILYNGIRMMELYKRCTLKIDGKVLYFKEKRTEKYDYESSDSYTYKSYSPIYEITYKDNKYRISNTNYNRFATKIVKQGRDYKLRINPNILNMYIDRLVIVSKLVRAFWGIGLITLGLFVSIN